MLGIGFDDKDYYYYFGRYLILSQQALPYPTKNTPPLSLSYTASIPIEIGPKQLGAEMTQGRNNSPT